ncbi:chlorophyll a/b-binding protein [Nodosilinea sp. FACHB-13]|uniref:chlorophyll a/b-binding protein n=1 Tax=Cyanophyceae TaxID=3028117 RepID=UPI0016858C5E|nr:chlorophyll a/b-binding protein [Nodosilinea sp. FACHB-13]MBD2106677.1 hypothetical protein [Nodosilinea sp. FACHB-13]
MPNTPNPSETREWGFTRAAESLNGRMAMLGFAFAVAIEALSGQGVLHFLNLV